METIMKEVIARLETIEGLRYIAADDGQIDEVNENGHYPAIFPAALVDVDAVDWTTTNDPLQSGSGTLVIRFAWISPNRIDNNQSNARMNESINRWALHDKICQTLHGWSTTTTGPFERTRTERERREGLLKVMVITFAFEGGEDLTLPQPDPEV